MEQPPQVPPKESTSGDPEIIKVPRGTTERRWKIVLLSGILVTFLVGASIIYLSIAMAQGRQSSQEENSRGGETELSPRDPEILRETWRLYRATLVQELSPIDPQLSTQLSNPATAEWKALQWLLMQDSWLWKEEEDAATIDAPVLIQRFAIVTIYIHFQVQPWMQAAQHECDWLGVSCDDARISITALNLTQSSAASFTTMATNRNATTNTTAAMTGTTMPLALAYLSEELVSLDFSRLALKGTIPYPCYQQWNKLQFLNLDQNQLQRFFTVSDIVGTAVDGASTAVLLPSIQFINVRNNLLQESVVFFGNENDTTREILSGWPDLRHLDVRGNTGLVGPLLEYGLPFWKNIETLELAETSLTGMIPSNVSLAHLVTLEAWRVPFSGTLPSALATATQLETLSLGWSDQVWTGTLPESYAALTKLRLLSLSHLNGITGTLPAAWGSALSLLQSIDLFGNSGLTGPIPTTWGQMSALQNLRLSETSITGTIPTELGMCTNLVDVSLYRTQLQGTMPAEICRLRQVVLGKLSVDCAESSPGSNDAPVTCSRPDCCTLCTQLAPL